MCRTITIVYRCACCFYTTSSTLETIICEEKRVECQLVTQAKRMGKENALYYLSRMLVGAEHAYSPIEKHCLALVFAVKKLRHYMLTHQVTLISKIDPLKYLMTRPNKQRIEHTSASAKAVSTRIRFLARRLFVV
jgi:hypothetical protein